MDNPAKGKVILPNEEEQGFGVVEFRVTRGATFRDDHTYDITVVSRAYPGETEQQTYPIGRIFRDMDQFMDYGRWYDADEDDSRRGTPKFPVGLSMEEAVHKMFDRFVEKSNNPQHENPKKCQDCERKIGGMWRTGRCDACRGSGRDENDEGCAACEGTGSPVCCRCEGTGVDPEPEVEEMMIPMNLSPVNLRDRNTGNIYRFEPEGAVEVHVDEEGAAEAGVDVDDLIEASRRITGGGRSSNPVAERELRPQQGARLLIGFNVGSKKVWTVDGVLNLAFWFRRQQVAKAFAEGYAKPSAVGGDLGMTFLIQKGVWQPVGDKHAYPENGTSLILLNTINEEPKHFEQDMESLAEELATRLKQQAIIIEHQVRGIVEQTVTMLPR
jgi:hypothetical protein